MKLRVVGRGESGMRGVKRGLLCPPALIPYLKCAEGP